MNKLMRKQMESRHNNLWIGMHTKLDNKRIEGKPLSYRTKAEQRDRLKLEREEVWENDSMQTTMHGG